MLAMLAMHRCCVMQLDELDEVMLKSCSSWAAALLAALVGGDNLYSRAAFRERRYAAVKLDSCMLVNGANASFNQIERQLLPMHNVKTVGMGDLPIMLKTFSTQF